MRHKKTSSYDASEFSSMTQVTTPTVHIDGRACEATDYFKQAGGKMYPWLAATAMPPGVAIQPHSQPSCNDGNPPTLNLRFDGLKPSEQVVAWASDGTTYQGDDPSKDPSWTQFRAYTQSNTIALTQPSRDVPVYGTLCAPAGYTKTYNNQFYNQHIHYRVLDNEKHLMGPVMTVDLDNCHSHSTRSGERTEDTLGGQSSCGDTGASCNTNSNCCTCCGGLFCECINGKCTGVGKDVCG